VQCHMMSVATSWTRLNQMNCWEMVFFYVAKRRWGERWVPLQLPETCLCSNQRFIRGTPSSSYRSKNKKLVRMNSKLRRTAAAQNNSIWCHTLWRLQLTTWTRVNQDGRQIRLDKCFLFWTSRSLKRWNRLTIFLFKTKTATTTKKGKGR
jgi:hypothetical protein